MPFTSNQIDHINIMLDPNASDVERLRSLKWLTGPAAMSWEIWPSSRVREMTDAEMRLKRITERFKEILG